MSSSGQGSCRQLGSDISWGRCCSRVGSQRQDRSEDVQHGWEVLGGWDGGDTARENPDVVEEWLQRKCVRAPALGEKERPAAFTSRLKPPESRGIPVSDKSLRVSHILRQIWGCPEKIRRVPKGYKS